MDLDALARDVVDHYARADFSSPPFPPFYAHWAERELEMLPGGGVVSGDGPVHVGFQIEPSRYAALDDAQREALHRRCIPIARDVALLFCGRSGPLAIALGPPDSADEDGTMQVNGRNEAIAIFEAP